MWKSIRQTAPDQFQLAYHFSSIFFVLRDEVFRKMEND